MKEAEGLVAKQTKKISVKGRTFTHFVMRRSHLKGLHIVSKSSSQPFSQHPYKGIFHFTICSPTHHYVTPWCLQHHYPRVVISPLSPCKLTSIYQLISTSTTLEVWCVFLLFTTLYWHCFTIISEVCTILPIHAYLLSSCPPLCQW